MNEAHLKARFTKVMSNLKNKELETTYEKQARKKSQYIDTRKRID